MNETNVTEYKVTEKIVAAFVEAVDNEAFFLADIADVVGIGQEEGATVLQNVMESQIPRNYH